VDVNRSATHPGSSSETEDDPTLSVDAYNHVPVATARKALQRAERFRRKGHHEQAIDEFRRALAIDPQYYQAGIELALELETIGEVELAIETLQHLTRSAPNRALAFNTLAQILCDLHRYSDMEIVARQVMSIHPCSFRANLLLGDALVRQGQWSKEARRVLEYASLKYPDATTLLDTWPTQ
jgi:tetratricopeptide (TPR) repeat protein